MTVHHAPPAPGNAMTSHSGVPPRRADRLRLGGWSRADVAELAGALLGSFALTWLVYEELTTLSGGLGFFVCWFLAFLATYWAMARNRLGAAAAGDRLAAATVSCVGLLLAVGLAAILIYVAAKGYHALRPSFFTKDQFGVLPGAKPTVGGGLAAIVGTVEQVGLATLMSLPLGIATAVFLTEVRGRVARPVRLLTDAMSGIPSILTGLFVFGVLIESHVLAYSGFAVSLALTISMLPTITRTSEVVLRVVPGDLREASYALGGSEWRTVRRILLPTARTGLITAAILGVARVVGEAAPAIIDAGGSAKVNYNPFKGQQESLPLMIYNDIKLSLATEHVRAWTAALVLVFMILVLFVTARAIARPRTGRTRSPMLRFLDRKGTS
jgi:phosphate ABC transporter permease subunit PstA